MTLADTLGDWESVREAFLADRVRVMIRGSCRRCGETHTIAPDYDPERDAFRVVCPNCRFIKVARYWCGPDGEAEQTEVSE